MNVRILLGLGFGLMVLAGSAPRGVQAQELNCSVNVNIAQLSGSEFTFLRDIGPIVEEYMNDRNWTEDQFQEYERVDCLMQIIFEEAITLTSFSARIVLSTQRPIYGVPQQSTILQVTDEGWQFNYTQGTPFIQEQERYNPLTSILDFYAYIVLGYDYDTFSELGGTPYFERARRIAELAESQGAAGWEDLGAERGRADLIDQILDPRLEPLRRVYYQYHFGGLDLFVSENELARENVLEALKSLVEVYDNVSRQYVLDIFFGAKAEELAAIFEDSPLSPQAYELLGELDPANLPKYQKLIN